MNFDVFIYLYLFSMIGEVGWGPLSFFIFVLLLTFSFLTKKESRISSVSLRSAGYKGGAAGDKCLTGGKSCVGREHGQYGSKIVRIIPN